MYFFLGSSISICDNTNLMSAKKVLMLEYLTYKNREVQLHTLHFGIKTIVDKCILLSSLLLIINGALSPSIHMLEIADVYINHVTMVQMGLSFNPQMEAF